MKERAYNFLHCSVDILAFLSLFLKIFVFVLSLLKIRLRLFIRVRIVNIEKFFENSIFEKKENCLQLLLPPLSVDCRKHFIWWLDWTKILALKFLQNN